MSLVRISLLLATLCSTASSNEPLIEMLIAGNSFPSTELLPVDFDGDGDQDLVQLPNNGEDPHGYWMENLGGRSFAPVRICHIAPTNQNERLFHSAVVKLPDTNRAGFFTSRQAQAPGILHEPLLLTPASREPVPVQVASLAPASPSPWHAVDPDGDGTIALVQLEEIASGTWKLRIHNRQQDGSYAESTAVTFTTSVPLDSISLFQAIDLDGDGDLDLSVITPYRDCLIWERIGPREFAGSIVHPGLSGEVDRWLDVDGDGRPDLLSSDGKWRKNLGSMSFESWPARAEFQQAQLGRASSVSERPGEPALLWFIRQNGPGQFEFVTMPCMGEADPKIQQLPDFPELLRDCSFYDLDGDGHRDLVFSYLHGPTYPYSGRVAVSWGSIEGLLPPVDIHSASSRSAVIAGDFDGGGSDLILGPDHGGRFYIRINGGRDGLSEPQELTALQVPGHRVEITGAGDFNQDGHLDLICQCHAEEGAGAFPGVAHGDGNGGFQPMVLSGVAVPAPIYSGNPVDWDLDGDLDWVGSGHLLENVDGAFPLPAKHLIDLGTAVDLIGNPATIGFTITGDLDGDGSPDIISAVYGVAEGPEGSLAGDMPHQLAIGYNDGAGGISQIVTMPAVFAGYDFLGNPTVPGSVAIADLNQDGHPDLCLKEISGHDSSGNSITTSRWLKNPGNGSRDPSSWESLPLSGSAFPDYPLGDINGDGSLEWIDRNGILKATPAGPISGDGTDFTDHLGLTFMDLTVVGDIDADGDSDLIFGGRDLPQILIYNPTVNGRSPITRALIAAGVSPHLAGPDRDADGDGHTNLDELITGTHLLEPDSPSHDPFLLNVHVYPENALLSFRLPARPVGLGPSALTTGLQTLGVYHQMQHSEDLIHWSDLDMDSVQTIFWGESHIYLNMTMPRQNPRAFFRLIAESREQP